MTTTASPNTELIHAIARSMLDNLEIDAILDFMTDIRRRISEIDFELLAAAFELCPIHICDYRICADDNIDECAHLR